MRDAIEKHLNDEKAPQNIKERFMNKLDEIRKKSIDSRPTDQEMKIWCLRNEERRYNSCGQGYKGNTPETAPDVLKSIEQFFSSTSTEKEKDAAQEKLQELYKNERYVLPFYIEKRIFPEQPAFYESCFLPTKIIDEEPSRIISETIDDEPDRSMSITIDQEPYRMISIPPSRTKIIDEEPSRIISETIDNEPDRSMSITIDQEPYRMISIPPSRKQ